MWLRWLFPRVSPRYISVDTHTFVNKKPSQIAVYPHSPTQAHPIPHCGTSTPCPKGRVTPSLTLRLPHCLAEATVCLSSRTADVERLAITGYSPGRGMDHLPNLTCPTYSHPQVPFLPYERGYDGLGWKRFPERSGWDSDAFLRSDFRLNSILDEQRLASVLQTWLYFGTLAEVLDTDIDMSDFIVNSDRGRIVRTSALCTYINEWRARMEQLGGEKRAMQCRRIDTFFQEAAEYFAACLGGQGFHPAPIPDEILLSIVILHGTLCIAKTFVFPESTFWPSGYKSGFIATRMIADGWCPTDLSLLEETSSLSALGYYYASLLGPRKEIRDHSACSDVACMVFQIDEDIYRTTHVSEDCNCPSAYVSSEELTTIIQKPNGIPLVHFMDGALHIVEWSASVPYVAISHVWADGLGNPLCNGLPICQLSRLQDRVNNSTTAANVLFWMDTLCIPVGPEHSLFRKLAIARMQGIYESAALTLVINAELDGRSCSRDSQELAFRIAHNSWWRRLWTLQEGVSSSRLLFQFEDGTVDPAVLLQQENTTEFDIAQRILHEALEPLKNFNLFKIEPKERRIFSMLRTVARRSTSHPDDEAVCLATILGIGHSELEEIIHEPAETKLFKFILKQRDFPSDCIFFIAPRMTEDGYRWAPLSFVSRAWEGSEFNIGISSSLGNADIAGFHVSYPGFTFDKIHLPSEPEDKLVVRAPDGDLFQVHQFIWVDDARTRLSWDEMTTRYRVEKFAVIIQDWPLKQIVSYTPSWLLELEMSGPLVLQDFVQTQIDNWQSQSSRLSRVILGIVLSETHDEIVVRLINAALIGRYIASGHNRHPALNVVEVEQFRIRQKWCIR